MKKIWIPLLLFVILSLQNHAHADKPRVVTGQVILDNNRNGKSDKGEKGLPNVLITDGIQFVRTTKDGSFRITITPDPVIPWQPARVISVCWPTGYWPVKRQWWIRLHDLKPDQSCDFFLHLQKQKLPFTIAHATDPHNNFSTSEFFRDEILRMADDVDLCLITGDLGYAGRKNAVDAFTTIRRYTQSFPVPMFHAPGNHDIVGIHSTQWSVLDSLAGYGPYTQFLGPIRWSFDYAGVHLVGLDWARIDKEKKLQTGVPDVAIEWLTRDLEKLKSGTRILLFMHHHWRPDEKFWNLLVQHKVELLLAGHSHRNLDQSRRGIKALTTMNLRGPYRLVTVHEKGHSVVNRCYGCKAYGGTYHSRRCKLKIPPGASQIKDAAHKEVRNRKVNSTMVLAKKLTAKNLQMLAEIQPGGATNFGIRIIAEDQKSNPVEITCGKDEIQIGDLRTTVLNARGQKGISLNVFIKDGKLRVLGNHRFELEGTFALKGKCTVSLFSRGGNTLFRKVAVWDAPDNP